jgi:hypothetical protein
MKPRGKSLKHFNLQECKKYQTMKLNPNLLNSKGKSKTNTKKKSNDKHYTNPCINLQKHLKEGTYLRICNKQKEIDAQSM